VDSLRLNNESIYQKNCRKRGAGPPPQFLAKQLTLSRAVGRSENSGVPVLLRRHNLPPLVEIGLTDRPKIGSAMAPLAPPGTTGLLSQPGGQIMSTTVLRAPPDFQTL
jgi:hypothetical protein